MVSPGRTEASRQWGVGGSKKAHFGPMQEVCNNWRCSASPGGGELLITGMGNRSSKRGLDGCMHNACMDTSIIIVVPYGPGLALHLIGISSFNPSMCFVS